MTKKRMVPYQELESLFIDSTLRPWAPEDESDAFLMQARLINHRFRNAFQVAQGDKSRRGIIYLGQLGRVWAMHNKTLAAMERQRLIKRRLSEHGGSPLDSHGADSNREAGALPVRSDQDLCRYSPDRLPISTDTNSDEEANLETVVPPDQPDSRRIQYKVDEFVQLGSKNRSDDQMPFWMRK